MRLFISINFEEEALDFIYTNISRLKKEALSMSPSARENLHLTLAFIGDTDRIKYAKSALDSIDFNKFSFILSGIGKFPRSDGDIYWLGIKNCDELKALAEKVRLSLEKEGFELKNEKFSPHVTLARRVICKGDACFDTGCFKINASKISLMSSERKNGRLIYTEIYKKEI